MWNWYQSSPHTFSCKLTIKAGLLNALGIFGASWCTAPDHSASRLHSGEPLRNQKTWHFSFYKADPLFEVDKEHLWRQRNITTFTWSFNAAHRMSISPCSSQSTWSIRMTWDVTKTKSVHKHKSRLITGPSHCTWEIAFTKLIINKKKATAWMQKQIPRLDKKDELLHCNWYYGALTTFSSKCILYSP
jgi:hypothetical protein